ncbi:MAG: hypothetical protein ACPGRW_06030 [Flavobacteriaceae bacterium]
MTYLDFLNSKTQEFGEIGFLAENMNKNLFDFQKHIVIKALKIGRYEVFAGIGSEGHESLKLNRKFTGIELKPSYFEQMKRNLHAFEKSRFQLEMF